jgi:hypothetical protein
MTTITIRGEAMDTDSMSDGQILLVYRHIMTSLSDEALDVRHHTEQRVGDVDDREFVAAFLRLYEESFGEPLSI